MAKNISNNQWFKDIIDNVYINTAAINDILIISVSATKQIAKDTIIAKARDPKLFNFVGKNIDSTTGITIYQNGNLINTENFNTRRLLMVVPLKTKQLETDFYSTEQLAEMYPDDPAYQATGILDGDIPDEEKSEPTIESPVSGTESAIASEVSNNDEPY